MRTSSNARRWAASTGVTALLLVGLNSVGNAVAEPEAQRTTAVAAAAPARLGQPNLYTSDVDKMLDFYKNALGFQVDFRFPAAGTAAFGTVSKGDAYYITFTSFDTIKQNTPLKHIGKSTQKQSDIAVLTADVDAAFTKAKNAGAKVLMAPKNQPWGERQAYVADPEGNYVQISTHSDH
ncbi:MULTISPECIES: glyoxalase/bleomycin resistance/extradiol dioxygenase family protein [unclassified Streptomyces]|uniref:VOC family protein n=1 Tax=unclassified Streptomyces TaxID=2593676 RepID=UPI000DD7C879|nr:MULTISPECIES: VOC family protein [unclassified Streptomyces]QZZ30733.1 VOC family protein [Streptomyces sp. ST1015]